MLDHGLQSNIIIALLYNPSVPFFFLASLFFCCFLVVVSCQISTYSGYVCKLNYVCDAWEMFEKLF